MKNVVKKLFSLLLVGVVAVSMFSFVAPPAEAAEAAEANSYGTLIIRNKAWYTAGFHVTFYNFFGGNLGEYDTGYLEGLSTRNPREFKIPKDTYRVHVYMAIEGGKKKTIDFYADESAVNEKSRIELSSINSLFNPELEAKYYNGWSEKKPEEYSHEECIHFQSYFNADNPNMYFKATFYRYGYQIGEKSVKLSNIGDYHIGTVVDREFIEIPNSTTSIKVEVIKEGTPFDSATLEYIPAKKAKNGIIITLGDAWYGSWEAMKVNCPNSWKCPEPPKPAEAGSNGTLSIRNNLLGPVKSYVTFYGLFGEYLGDYDTGYVGTFGLRDIKIPKKTYRVHVVYAAYGGRKKTINFYADALTVNENSRIELTCKNATQKPMFDVEFDVDINYGWK